MRQVDVEFLRTRAIIQAVDNQDANNRSSLLIQAVKRVMRPIVRALMANGISAPKFYGVLKETYIEVARAELGDTANDSRISVMTGVHRRDVKAFRSAGDGDDMGFSKKVSTLSTVVGRWLSTPALLDDAGQPVPLPRASDTGQSFDALVESISRDVRPRAVLDALLAQGVVDLDGETVSLNTDAVVGPADMDQKLHYFSQNLGDHASAAVDNLVQSPSPFLERAVFYNNLSPQTIATLEAQARASGMALLHKLNQDAAALQAEDADQSDAKQRFRFGIYFYSEDVDRVPQEKSKAQGQDDQ